MTKHTRDTTAEALGARWTQATDLLAHEAVRFGRSGLPPFERRRSVRRIQALERVARRAMNDYRGALQRELAQSLTGDRKAS
jgi:hypothetical protein